MTSRCRGPSENMSSSGGGGFDQRPWRQVCQLLQGSLCHLDTRPLSLPYPSLEKFPIPLTKESERALLVSLTTVFRKIRQWTCELDNCDSSQDEDNRFVGAGSFSSQSDSCNLDKEGHVCLAHSVSLLLTFFAVENSFVRHSAGKIFVAVFDFIAKSGSNCVEYFQCLWLTLTELFSSTFWSSELPDLQDSYSVYPIFTQHFGEAEAGQLSEGHNFDPAHFITAIRQSLSRPSYSMVTHIAEVLFNILKLAKTDYADLLEMNTRLSISAFSSMPWESLNGKTGNSKPVWLFFGALLRILCSLTDRTYPQDGASALDEFSVYSKFTSMVHKIISCCFSHHEEEYSIMVSHYLKHKSMMLIIRLSFGAQWKCSYALLWLDFLKLYYEDLLLQPISKCHSGHNKSLEGSPFQVVYGESIYVPCICHLQRQAIFVFLKCCVTLVSPSNSGDLGSCCSTLNASVPFEAPNDTIKSFKKGVYELYLWIQGQSSSAKCVELGFSLSLLQLYMDEDDMLFETLLLLLDDSLLNIHQKRDEISESLTAIDQDVASCISNMVNPLNYDHSVLLDYLISKDVGIQCVRYLLRCLRIVCSSWPTFTEFHMNKPESAKSPLYSLPGSCYATDMAGCLSEERSDRLSEERLGCFNQRHLSPCFKRQKVENESFENAKRCLLSLKSSVQDLHQKKIFPYNPSALLKSFSRFEELCLTDLHDVR